MRILIYSTNYYPEMTGIAKYNTEMAEWLVSKGYKVDIFTAMPSYPEWEIYENYKGKKFTHEIINGVNVYRSHLYVPNKKNISGIKRIFMQTTFSISSLRFWIPAILNKKEYDLVIALCPPMIPLVNVLIYKGLKKSPVLLHVQDLEFDAAIRLGIIKQKFLLKILNNVEIFFLNKVNIISSITNSMINRIKAKKLKNNNFLLFPNWADIQFITPLPKKNDFRQEINIRENDKIIMYSGNMGEKQGLEIVLEVAKKFKNQHIDNVKFVFVGDGVAKKQLIQMKNSAGLDNVLFFPIQPLEKLPELLASADMHLVIQKREAADLVMPSKLTNILSAGRTVIATAEEGTTLHDVITSSNSGLVIEPENSERLYDAVLNLLNRGSLSNYEYNARNYAEEYLDKELILKKFEKNINKLLNKGDC